MPGENEKCGRIQQYLYLWPEATRVLKGLVKDLQRRKVGLTAAQLEMALELAAVRFEQIERRYPLAGYRTSLEHMEAHARTVADLIDKKIPAGTAFILCLAHFGEKGWATYISNSDRSDTIKLLREMADTIEAKQEKMVEPYPGEVTDGDK